MFKASLKNNNIPELGTVTVEFPIPEAQYEETIRALNGIQSGAVVEQDCFVADIGTADCPALERLIGTMANVDELDWLGKQLESFDRYELLQFNAAVERFGLSAADELIDLSFCAREVTVISDFSDLERVGRKHYLTVHGACDPKELENLDGKETALALISGQPGYQEEQGRFLVPELIKLQLVIAHNLPELRYIKRGKPCAAGNQYAFGGFARDEKSRTFSSNSKRSHILRTSSRSRRLILSSIVSLAVSLKWTRTI